MSNFGKKYDPNKRSLNKLKRDSKADLNRTKRESFKQSNKSNKELNRKSRKQIKNKSVSLGSIILVIIITIILKLI